MSMKRLVQLMILSSFVLATSAQAVGLLGDMVDMSVTSVPDQNGVTVDGTVEGTFTFGSDESIDIDISDSAIRITAFDFTDFWFWATDPVIVTISDLDYGTAWSIVTSEFTNNLGSVIWDFGADFITASFSGDVSPVGSGVVLDIQAELVINPIPEPSSALLFCIGALVVSGTLWRRAA